MSHDFTALRSAISEYSKQYHKFNFDPQNPSIRLHEPTFSAEEIFAFTQQLLTTHVTMGPNVKAFEQAYADWNQMTFGVTNNSGSSANLLAIAAICNPKNPKALKPGDEVIVPALAWSTTIWPIIQYGLIPVFIDCDPDTLNIDSEKVSEAISPKTKAIMPIHVYGNPCDMNAVTDICKKHHLWLIEDCCEAMGAKFSGQRVGSFGDINTFSFYYSHHITMLEGGICLTNNALLDDLMRSIRSHGWTRGLASHEAYTKQHPDIDPRFIFITEGYNLRITEPQAVMGLQQLKKLNDIIKKRQAIANAYIKRLKKYEAFFNFQKVTAQAEHSWFGFIITLKPDTPFTREDITGHLNHKKIETRPVIAGNMLRHPALVDYTTRSHGDFTHADYVMSHSFAIGCHHALNDNAADYLLESIESFIKTYIGCTA